MYTPSNFKLARRKKQITHHTNSFLSSDAPNLILLLQEFMNPINSTKATLPMVRTSTEKRMDITALSVQSKEINRLLHCNFGLTQGSQMKTLNLTTKQPLILECQVVKQLLTSPEWATSGAACERSSGAMPGCQGTTAEVVLVQLPHHPPSKQYNIKLPYATKWRTKMSQNGESSKQKSTLQLLMLIDMLIPHLQVELSKRPMNIPQHHLSSNQKNLVAFDP
jgi:hypothetical protein